MARYRKKPVVIDAVRWRGYHSNLGITAEAPDQPIEITADNMHGIKWEPLPEWLPKPLLAGQTFSPPPMRWPERHEKTDEAVTQNRSP